MDELSRPSRGRRRTIALDVDPSQTSPTKRMRGAIAPSPKKKKTGRGKRFRDIEKSVEESRPQIRTTPQFRNDRDRVTQVKDKFRKFAEYYRDHGYPQPSPTALAYIRKNFRSFILDRDLVVEGTVPGVEIGDEFSSRAELSLVSLHNPLEAGIAVKDIDDRGTPTIIATSIVLSGKYEDDEDEGDTLLYTGVGGRDVKTGRQVEDQALEGGNFALYNSMRMNKPVRVIRSWQDVSPVRKVYSYDGLYRVLGYGKVPGISKFHVYKFKLVRSPDQPLPRHSPYMIPNQWR